MVLMAVKRVKVITSSVYGPDGSEVIPPGTVFSEDVPLPPEVRYRVEEITIPDPEPAPAVKPVRHATVRPDAAAGKGSAHT